MFSLSSGGVTGASSTKAFGKYAIDGAATTAEGVIAISTHNLDRNLKGLTKNEMIKAIVTDCHSSKKRKNGRTDRRILFSPPSEIGKLLTVEQMLSTSEIVVAEIIPDWKGYLIVHVAKDGQKHTHGVFSVDNLEGKRIDVSAKELEKMHKKYNELLEENFLEEMSEYRDKMKEKIENMTDEEKTAMKKNGLMKGNTSIRKRKTVKNEEGKIEMKIKKNVENYKTEAAEKGIFTLDEARDILRNAISTMNILDQEVYGKIVKTINYNSRAEYAETKKGKQFLAKIKEYRNIYINFVNSEKKEKEMNSLQAEIQKLKEEWKEKVKAVAEQVSVEDIENYKASDPEIK